MRRRRTAFALVASAAMTLATAVAFAPDSLAAGTGAPLRAAAVVCSAPAWAEGTDLHRRAPRSPTAARLYQALVTHTAYVGAGWNPAATPSLWRTSAPVPAARPHVTVHATDHRRPTTTRAARRHPARRPRRPHHLDAARRQHLRGEVAAGRQGAAGLLGELGRRRATACTRRWAGSRSPTRGIAQHGYNVINAAFPVIRSDGTVLWEDGMDAGREGGHARPRCARPRRPARRS